VGGRKERRKEGSQTTRWQNTKQTKINDPIKKWDKVPVEFLKRKHTMANRYVFKCLISLIETTSCHLASVRMATTKMWEEKLASLGEGPLWPLYGNVKGPSA
jgi:hypothetical protein